MGKLRVLRMFKKRTVARQLENLEDKIEDSFKPTPLEIAANYFTILGTAVSLVLAFWAINLTRKYGESKDQINRLDTLATQQKNQIDKLVTILGELQNQNALTSAQNNELISQGKQISNQSNDISKQVKISQEEEKKSIFLTNLQRRSYLNRAKRTFAQISELLPHQGANFVKQFSGSQQFVFLSKFKTLLEVELDNSALLENDSAFLKWSSSYAIIKNQLEELTVSPENYLLVKEENGEIIHTNDSLAVQKSKNISYNYTIDKCFDFYFFFNRFFKKNS